MELDNMIINNDVLEELSARAKANPRLRQSMDLRNSPEDLSHRMLNAVEPGTVVPIHRQPAKDESFVVLRGKVKVSTYDDSSVIESIVLCQEEGRYGVDIPKNVWHNLESLESRSVIIECKEGPFVPNEQDGWPSA